MNDFETTRWGLIEQARSFDVGASRQALGELCQIYRPAILAYARAILHKDDAEDLTQAFFVKFIEARMDQRADQERGRFRGLLKVAFKNFIANEQQKMAAFKRTAVDVLFVDGVETPEIAFDKAWAKVLAKRAIVRLHVEAAANNRQALFSALLPYLLEAPEAQALQVLGEQLKIRANTLAVNLKRMRARFRELIKDELLQTVSSQSEFLHESQDLRSSMGV